MPRVRELFPSGFIAAEDLYNGDATLTISHVTQEGVPTPPSYKPVKSVTVAFAEMVAREKKTGRPPQKLKLNRTNAKTIAKLYGAEVTEWVGKRVTLYATTCKLGKDTVPCIRIRDAVPPPAKKQAKNQAQPPPEPENEPNPYEAEE